MFYYNAADREVKDLITGIHARTFWGEKMMMVIVELDANAILPKHNHTHEQGGIVLEGELEFIIGGWTGGNVVGATVEIRKRLMNEQVGLFGYNGMKLITLERILWTLEEMAPEVKVPEEIRLRAKAAVDRMLEAG